MGHKVTVWALASFIACLPGVLNAQASRSHSLVPYRGTPAGFEVVWGDPSVAGMPFVIRIRNDPGLVILPHTHPRDENIVVIKGRWSLGMGTTVHRKDLEVLEEGDYVMVPAEMAHFAFAETEVVEQVHGIGPFSVDFVDPVYELGEGGVSYVTVGGAAGERVESYPADCFSFSLGNRVGGTRGEGTVKGALCSPANGFTQYWVETQEGRRFWASTGELSLR